MTLFGWLLVGHLAGDFLLQTRWMAEQKAHAWIPLLAHAGVYAAVTGALASLAGGLSLTGLALVLMSHILIDRRTLVNWWADHVTQAGNQAWLRIVLDQSWHLVMLALATLI